MPPNLLLLQWFLLLMLLKLKSVKKKNYARKKWCLLLKFLKLKSVKKNYARKVTNIGAPFPEKNSEYAPDTKTLAYLHLFSGLNVFAFS